MKNSLEKIKKERIIRKIISLDITETSSSKNYCNGVEIAMWVDFFKNTLFICPSQIEIVANILYDEHIHNTLVDYFGSNGKYSVIVCYRSSLNSIYTHSSFEEYEKYNRKD